MEAVVRGLQEKGPRLVMGERDDSMPAQAGGEEPPQCGRQRQVGHLSCGWGNAASRGGRKDVVIDGQLLRTRIVIRRLAGYPLFFSLGMKRGRVTKR